MSDKRDRTLTLHNGAGDVVLRVPHLTLLDAVRRGERERPVPGSSYITMSDTDLVFKPYRPYRITRCKYPSMKRTTPKGIEAAARRMEADGDHENAAEMRKLLTQ